MQRYKQLITVLISKNIIELQTKNIKPTKYCKYRWLCTSSLNFRAVAVGSSWQQLTAVVQEDNLYVRAVLYRFKTNLSLFYFGINFSLFLKPRSHGTFSTLLCCRANIFCPLFLFISHNLISFCLGWCSLSLTVIKLSDSFLSNILYAYIPTFAIVLGIHHHTANHVVSNTEKQFYCKNDPTIIENSMYCSITANLQCI